MKSALAQVVTSLACWGPQHPGSWSGHRCSLGCGDGSHQRRHGNGRRRQLLRSGTPRASPRTSAPASRTLRPSGFSPQSSANISHKGADHPSSIPSTPVKVPDPPSVSAPAISKALSLPSVKKSGNLSYAKDAERKPGSGSSVTRGVSQGLSSATGAAAARQVPRTVASGVGAANTAPRPGQSPALKMAQVAPLRAFFIYVWPAVALTPWLSAFTQQWEVALTRFIAASGVEGVGGGLSTTAGGSLGRAAGEPASSDSNPLPFSSWLGADSPLPVALIYVFLASSFAAIWLVASRELGLPIGRRRWRHR